MDNFIYQIIAFWVTVGIYVLSFVFFTIGITFKKDKYANYGVILIILAFLSHTAALIIRWIQVGHGPFYDFWEVIPSDAWVGVLLYIIFQFFFPKLRLLGAFVAPVSFLMIAFAILGNIEMESIPQTYSTYWLVIHIIFAKLAYGSCLIAAAVGFVYLVKDKKEVKKDGFLDKLPSLDKLDELSYRFASFGFIMLGAMILSGAIWANLSWGRYWNWDPIETWALISWFIYGIYLHTRFTFRWKGKKGAWFTILAFGMVIFAYFISPFLYNSIHEHLGR